MTWLKIPGGSLFAPKTPALPPVSAPVTSEDPAIAESKKKARIAATRRQGFAATLVAPKEDALGTAPVTRPTATRLGS